MELDALLAGLEKGTADSAGGLVLLQRARQGSHLWPSYSTSRCIPKSVKNTHSHKNLVMNDNIISHNTQKVEPQLFISLWVNKQMHYIHTLEYYSAIRSSIYTHCSMDDP